jgi:hypothetical protein
MNVFLLGLKITAEAQNTDEETINVLGEMPPSNDKRVNTKIQLVQQKNHYIGKLLKELKTGQFYPNKVTKVDSVS